MTVWPLAVRNVGRNRRRSLLTGGVVAAGFTAFALAGGFMAQTFEALREGTIRGGTGHVQLADPGAFAGAEEASLQHGLAERERVTRIVRADAAVVEVLPRIDFLGLCSNGSRSVPFLGIGLDPAPEARSMDLPATLASGRWLAGSDDRAVVLGGGLAAALSVEVGDTVTLLGTTVDGALNAVDATVAGIAVLPLREANDSFLATDLGLAADLLEAPDRVSKLVVVLEDGADAARVRDRLVSALSRAGFVLAGRTWKDLAAFYRQVRNLYIAIFGFMGIVLTGVVLLAAANTMTMSAAERTREIGTLRALGTRPSFVRRLFLAEGVVLAAAACVTGAVLSLLIRAVLNRSGIVLPPPPGVTRGAPIYVALYPSAYLAGALVMGMTLVLASYFPARRAARMPIIEALSHV